ncbi:MAG: hypothetical protein JKY37_25645 [Nannocystaceae bacterium]|nr:hypothetical protein [Nannocystaceae bacterium]
MLLTIPITLSLAPVQVAPLPQLQEVTTVQLRVTADEAHKDLALTLERRLSDRLLQDGHRVVPEGAGAKATVVVLVHLDDAGARVETRGIGRRIETVADGDPEVVALEVQQLTTFLVDEAEHEAGHRDATGAPRSIAVHLDGGPSLEPELLARLQVGLLDRGFALTRRPVADDLRLCVGFADEAWRIDVVGGTESCTESDRGPRPATLDFGGAQLPDGVLLDGELLDRASAVLGRTTRDSTEPAPPQDSEPGPELTPVVPLTETDQSEEKQDPKKSLSVTLTAAGVFVARAGGVDGGAGVRLRFGQSHGVGGAIEVGVVPAFSGAVRVVETTPAASVDWRIGVGERGWVSLGVFGGVHVHQYFPRDADGARGQRLGPRYGGAVRVALQRRRGLVVFGGAKAGVSGGGWFHVRDGRTVWRRSRVFVGLQAGLGWDFAVRGRR